MGEVREDGGLMVAGVGECDSRGVHKGEIIDFELALGAVRRALESAETNARRAIGDTIYLAASGGRRAGLSATEAGRRGDGHFSIIG